MWLWATQNAPAGASPKLRSVTVDGIIATGPVNIIRNYQATRGRAKGNLKAASAEFSRFCSATASWGRVTTERRSTRKGDSHIEDFLSCSGDFFHFMLDGL